MASVKKLSTVWYCDSDEDRNNRYPYPGHTAVMKDGSMYMCLRAGEWIKFISSGGGGGSGGNHWDPITPQK